MIEMSSRYNFNKRVWGAYGDTLMHLLILSKNVILDSFKGLLGLCNGFLERFKVVNSSFTRSTYHTRQEFALWQRFFHSCEQCSIILGKQILGVRYISYRLVKPAATHIYMIRSCINPFCGWVVDLILHLAVKYFAEFLTVTQTRSVIFYANSQWV